MTGDSIEQRLQCLVDDLEIRRVMQDYAAAVDARDWTVLRTVLADDLVVDYHNGRTIVRGGDAVVTYIRENTAHLAWQHHNVSTYRVDVDGDTATGLTYLISHQQIAEDLSHLLMMVARYDCQFRRRDDRWQLSRMAHTIQANNFVPHQSAPPSDLDIPPAVRP
ncbi:nuclear transport factor 2 family protein [Nocardioides sp. YIM 152315]|uniref:nuclear transport factor 2 family protein n=1 Tax=Nocardioides sp. YIM 152315 TaxID=3031760 RepID=UPI0023DC6305|nr:nuclear transport factor 2 family protein [Nocardioides sp. YIM 152315]MDF1602232.1 nuclear transport factor 2 family protein [Nocardioides sp. YIM 152315]